MSIELQIFQYITATLIYLNAVQQFYKNRNETTIVYL